MATQEQILFSAPGGPLGRLRTRVLLSRYLKVNICHLTRCGFVTVKEVTTFRLDHAFFGPGTTVEPFCRLEKLGDRPIFTCLQT